MGTSRQQAKVNDRRRHIAAEAARVMCEEGVRDYYQAKRKAAARLGLTDERQLPKNTEIQAAVREHQRLFQRDSQPHSLRARREAAIEAMQFFEQFRPRLVGPVLEGTADAHSSVVLHLFADPLEEITLFLLDQGIPFDEDSREVKVARGRSEIRPVYRFTAGDIPFELVCFPGVALRQAPLSRIDGRPMQRAALAAVQSLLEDDREPIGANSG